MSTAIEDQITDEQFSKRKVVAATAGALGGTQVADFANWCVSQAWFDGSDAPAPVSAFVSGVVVTLFTLGAGYFTKSAPGE